MSIEIQIATAPAAGAETPTTAAGRPPQPPRRSPLHPAAWAACLVPLVAYGGLNLLYGYFARGLVHCEGTVFGAKAACTPGLGVDALALPLPDTVAKVPAKLALHTAALQAAEANARMGWMSAVVAVIVVAIFVSALAGMWTWQSISDWRVRCGALVAGAAGVVLAFVFAMPNAREFLVVQQVFRKEVVPAAVAAQGIGAAGWVRGITFASVALLVLATGALLYRDPAQETDAEDLEKRGRRLQWVLYASAVTLIVALLEFRSLFSWAAAAATLNGRGTASLITSLADAAAGSTGAVYAVALAAFYLPALFLLRARADVMARTEKPADKPLDTWLQEKNVGFTIPKMLGTMLTVLSPLLAQAPIAVLVKLLQ